MIVYFNNSQGKLHANLYGKGAFFDLWASDARATNLSPGQTCIVASDGRNNQITSTGFRSHAKSLHFTKVSLAGCSTAI